MSEKIESVNDMEIFEKGLTPFSREETRDKIAGLMGFFPEYWASAKIESKGSQQDLAERIAGFGHTLFSALDGSGLSIPSMLVAPRSELPARELGCEGGLFAALAKKLSCGPELMERAKAFADIGLWAPWCEDDAERSKDQLMAPIKIASLRWGAWAKEHGLGFQASIEGFSLSIAAVLEGWEGGGLGYLLAPCPSDEDKPYHLGRGERWHECMPEGDPALEADLGGGLRYAWCQRWAKPEREGQCDALIASIDERRELAAALPQGWAPKAKPRV